MADNKKITIAYILTHPQMAYVSVQSLIENNSTYDLDIYCIYDEELEKSEITKFKKLENDHKNVSMSFIPIKGYNYRCLKNADFTSIFYLFELPNLIKSDKILMLHYRSLITGDIGELWNTDISDYHCAAVENLESENLIKTYDLKFEKVIAHETLLINVKKWLEDEITKKILNYEYLKNWKNQERIPSNLLCTLAIPKCKFINLEYGYLENWWNRNFNPSCSLKVRNDYKAFHSHLKIPKIILFGSYTPIEDTHCNHSYKNLWWQYAQKTEFYDEIKDFRKHSKYKLCATAAVNSFKYSWLLKRIFPYIKPYLFRIILGFLIAIPLGLLDGVTAFMLKPYMDYVVGNKPLEFSIFNYQISVSSLQMAFIIPLGVVFFAAFQGVLRYLNSYISSWTSERITNDVKIDLFHKLINMHPQFFDDNPSGIIISRYMSDPKTASAGIVNDIKTMTTSVFGALGLIAVMFYSSWKLAFVGVFILCVAFIPVVLIRKRIRIASNKQMVIGGNITTNINETYNGNKVMAAYGLQKRQELYFREQIKNSFNVSMSLLKRTAWMSPMMYLIASFGIASVLGYGTYLINTGNMTAGSFASFVTSLLLLYKPVKTLGNTLTGIQNIFVAMGRVFELFDLDSEIKNANEPQTIKGIENEIKFENVCFEYVPSKTVLNDINLIVPKNQTLALVGNSGGGKSTLVNLIPRFYDIKSGSIKIDDIDIKTIDINSLRNIVSVVFQDNFLFTGTIKENILMGKPNATTEELMQALEYAHLMDMINELPEGLETILGERGLTLSGGQRQRVAIARALLKNAPIVILDEATSALDNKSEEIVQKAMDNLMKNRTVFIIAHRLSTIKNADRIAVINEGKLVELGTHDELMQIQNGHYKYLYEMQFKNKQKVLN